MIRTKIQYKNQEIYLGIDVHRGKYAVSAVISGEEVDNFVYSGTQSEFALMLLRRYASASRVNCCYEAGFSGFVLQRELSSKGFLCEVVHPGSVEVSSLKRKTDKRDALKMSYQLYSGSLKGINIPSLEEEDGRRIGRLRRNLVKDRTRMRTRVRMLFNYYSILSSNFVGVLSYLQAQRVYVSNIANFGEGFKTEIGVYLDNWRTHTLQINKLTKMIKEASARSETDQYYLSVPGIGLLTARTLSTELGDMSRFKNVKHLYSYIGLTPSEFSSGEQRHLGRISREGKPIIRAMLIQAAWKAISQDEQLYKFYLSLKNKKGGKRAIVAVARKLAGIARSCVRDKRLYEMPVSVEENKLAA